MRIRLKLFYLLLLSFPLICCLVAVAWLLVFAYGETDRLQAWDKYLSQPIPDDIVTDLCSRNLIPPTIGNCQNKQLQIQLSSIPDIFRATIASGATKNDINQLFSDYLLDCKDDTDIPYSVRCQYKLADFYIAINYDIDTNKVVATPYDS